MLCRAARKASEPLDNFSNLWGKFGGKWGAQTNTVLCSLKSHPYCFKYASSLPQECFKYASIMLHVWFISSMFQVCFMSDLLQVCFMYESIMLQVGFKYPSDMLQVCKACWGLVKLVKLFEIECYLIRLSEFYWGWWLIRERLDIGQGWLWFCEVDWGY